MSCFVAVSSFTSQSSCDCIGLLRNVLVHGEQQWRLAKLILEIVILQGYLQPLCRESGPERCRSTAVRCTCTCETPRWCPGERSERARNQRNSRFSQLNPAKFSGPQVQLSVLRRHRVSFSDMGYKCGRFSEHHSPSPDSRFQKNHVRSVTNDETIAPPTRTRRARLPARAAR